MQRAELKGVVAEMDTLARNIKGQFKYADRLGARYTLVIGDTSYKGRGVPKSMAKSEQREIKIEDIYKETQIKRNRKIEKSKDNRS
ncbi:MAG: His/Gly/Thr/Pro-type tRNA ligase C-terminal domain-containing protein [Anaerovoracaceae bacterium]